MIFNLYCVHPHAELFPLMSDAELDELAADIKKRGLREKVKYRTYTQNGMLRTELLDGRNRLKALERLGLYDPLSPAFDRTPKFFEKLDLDEEQAIAFIVSANIHRRHLTAEQKRDLIGKLLKLDPSKSDRTIAATAKVSDKTVGNVRRTLEATAEIPQSTKSVGKDGRERPRPTPTTSKPAAPKPAPAAKRKQEVVADRASLAPSAQQRFDAALRAAKKQLENEFQQRVYDEAERRMQEVRLPHFLASLERARKIENAHKGVFSQAQFKTLLRVCHPDNSASETTRAEAFRLLQERETVLVRAHEHELTRKLPTLEEMDRARERNHAENRARAQKAAATRKANAAAKAAAEAANKTDKGDAE